jgi:hypothetical protein
MKLSRITSLALTALLLAGCSVTLRTAPVAVDACDEALIGGQLVATAQSGLGIRGGETGVVEVLWPFGYTARRAVSGNELLGHKGELLAREGDFVQAGGGAGADGIFAVCDGTVQVVQPPS